MKLSSPYFNGKPTDLSLDRSQSGDELHTQQLTPTVNVLNALSAALGEGVGTVRSTVLSFVVPTHPCPPTQLPPVTIDPCL